MVAQSFLYNSVFFTLGLVLSHFYKVPSERIGLYLLPLAIGNFCGPLFLGSLFDTVGRKAMIAGTFAISGLLLLLTAYLFAAGLLTPVTQTIAWFSIFFFASAAASSAYLTASEIFPLETRALAIACFYALGTAIGGSTSPLLFGWLIESGSAWRVSAGYALAAALLLIAAGTELVLGIDAEGKSLESIADPLSSKAVPRTGPQIALTTPRKGTSPSDPEIIRAATACNHPTITIGHRTATPDGRLVTTPRMG